MPFHLGTTELVIIFVLVLLLFGGGRISKVAGELGTAIRSFRKEVKSDKSEKE